MRSKSRGVEDLGVRDRPRPHLSFAPSGAPGAGKTRENATNNTIEANMLLKTKDGVGKRTQNEFKFGCQMRAVSPKNGPFESSSNAFVPSGAKNLPPGLPVSKYPGKASFLSLPRHSRAGGNLPAAPRFRGVAELVTLIALGKLGDHRHRERAVRPGRTRLYK